MTTTSKKQWTDALATANQVRLARAAMVAEIRNGQRDVLEVIEHDESGIKLVDVLQAIPRIGDVACDRMLNEAGLSHSLCLGGRVTSCYRPATERERGVIADLVREFLGRRERARHAEAAAA